MATVQGEYGRVSFFEDFLAPNDDGGQAISDATPLIFGSNVTLIPVSGNVQFDSVVTAGNGIATFSGAAGAGDGIFLTSSANRPDRQGPLVVGARFKASVLTTLQMGIGFVQTVDKDEPTMPFTLSGTTLTANNVGQVAALYYDTTATTDDWRFMAANAGTALTTAIGLNGAALGTLGTRAVATLTADEWMLAELVMESDGRVYAYYGDGSVNSGQGMKQVGYLAPGNLTLTVTYHPVLWLIDPSTTDPTWSVDFFYGRAGRDWTI